MIKRKNTVAAHAEKLAMDRLSSFYGENNFEGFYEGQDDNYVGYGDDSLQFSGSGSSFLTAGNASDLTFSFRLQNASESKKVIALFPTYLATAAALATASGQTVDAILTDGTIITSVTGTASDSMVTIDNMQKFVNKHPSQIVEITISANTALAFNEVIVVKELSPFRQLPGNKIPLTKYVLPDQYNSSKVVLPIWRDFNYMAANDQLAVLLPIGGTGTVATSGVIMDVTISFGAIRNTAAELANKVKRASGNIERLKMKGVLK